MRVCARCVNVLLFTSETANSKSAFYIVIVYVLTLEKKKKKRFQCVNVKRKINNNKIK